MLHGITIFFSILGGGLLGMLFGVAIAMYKYEHDDEDDEFTCEIVGMIPAEAKQNSDEDTKAGEEN